MDNATEFLEGIAEALEAIRDRLTPRYIECGACEFWRGEPLKASPVYGETEGALAVPERRECRRLAACREQDGNVTSWGSSPPAHHGCGEGAPRREV